MVNRLLFCLCTLFLASCSGATKETFGELMWEEVCAFVHQTCDPNNAFEDRTKVYGDSMDTCLAKFSEVLSLRREKGPGKSPYKKIVFKTHFEDLMNDDTRVYDDSRVGACRQAIQSNQCELVAVNNVLLDGPCSMVFFQDPEQFRADKRPLSYQ